MAERMCSGTFHGDVFFYFADGYPECGECESDMK